MTKQDDELGFRSKHVVDNKREQCLYFSDLVEFDRLMGKYFPLWKTDFFDVHKVLLMGANKYAADGWLDKDGTGTSHKQMHDSMFHHLSMSYAKTRLDNESGLDHLLHVATRALMLYTRLKREIKNSKD